MPNTKLLPPVPPFANKADPKVIAWRQDCHEEAIEHLHRAKLELPQSSWLPLIGVVASLILGLAGLVSPAQIAQLLRLFVH